MPARSTSTRRPAGRPPAAAPARPRRAKKRPAAKRTTATRRPAPEEAVVRARPLAGGAGGWNLLARGAGGLARSVARPEEAEPLAPEHRRDGVGLAVLGLAIVLGAATWSNGIGPVGAGLAQAVRWIIGSLVMVLPVVLFFAALRLLRRPPSPEARGRLVIGWLSMIAAVLGIAQVVGRHADPEAGVPGSGGLLGWAVGTPLSAGVGAIVTVVLLALLGFFGLLVTTATPVHQIPERLQELDRPAARPRRRTTTTTYDDDEDDDEAERRGPPVPPQGRSSGGPPQDRPDRPRRDGRRRPRRRSRPSRSTRRSARRCARRSRTAPPRRRTCPPIDRAASSSRSSRSSGNYVLPVAHHAAPGHPAAGPVQGQRRRHRGDHRRPRAVQHRRRRHRLHPRPDGHPLRGRARARRSRSRRSPR